MNRRHLEVVQPSAVRQLSTKPWIKFPDLKLPVKLMLSQSQFQYSQLVQFTELQMTEWKSKDALSSSSQSSIVFQQTGGEGVQQTADCVGVGWLRNFAKIFLKFFFMFREISSNFAKLKIILFCCFAATLCRNGVRGRGRAGTALAHPSR